MFEERLQQFVAILDGQVKSEYQKLYPNLLEAGFDPGVKIDNRGSKYIKLSEFEKKHKRNRVVGFVVVKDSNTATMGELKKGDILMAATFKAPAKGVRGNIFDDDNGLSASNGRGCVRYAS